MSCRHVNSWLISGGSMSWCPDCGAIRKMRRVPGENAVEYRWRRWVYPKGQEKALRLLEAAEAGL